MCGIVGFFEVDTSNANDHLLRMCQTLVHRGPDCRGIWSDRETGIGLGHQRLSILDLSSAGNQPMHSANGLYVIVFNGEIYNHLELRNKLEREGKTVAWRGHSDTETLLTCIETWGISTTLTAIVGMFAIALWDRKNLILTLARDRMGEKPLYYGYQGTGTQRNFLFGSELKALRAHPQFEVRIDRDALALFLRYSNVPAPYSIYQNIYKLPPGHLLQLQICGNKLPQEFPQPTPYWQLNDVIAAGQMHLYQGNDIDAVHKLDKLLRRSIAGQMQSDVPLGAFLSGGIDSSLVTALMQIQSPQPIKTYTIGMHNAGHDEARHAKAIAGHLGTDHTELYITSDDALAVNPELSNIYCEPFSDSSQIPALLVSQLARRQVSVALSGDGGDELFGGYNRYHQAHKLWRQMHRMPARLRQILATGICRISPQKWDTLYRMTQSLIPKSARINTFGDKLHKLSDVLPLCHETDYMLKLTSHWNQANQIVIGAQNLPSLLSNASNLTDCDSSEHWMMAMDSQTYLPDDILVKLDRAAMAVSLETRVPMLDHRVVEFAWNLPLHMKIRQGQGKWILRHILYQYVPKALIERPKMGFGIPLDEWLRGPLREWAESLLNEHRLKREGFFEPEPIIACWQQHLSGKYNRAYHLWDVLMFQAWLEQHA